MAHDDEEADREVSDVRAEAAPGRGGRADTPRAREALARVDRGERGLPDGRDQKGTVPA